MIEYSYKTFGYSTCFSFIDVHLSGIYIFNYYVDIRMEIVQHCNMVEIRQAENLQNLHSNMYNFCILILLEILASEVKLF